MTRQSRHERFALRMARKYARLCRKAERIRKAGVAALRKAEEGTR